jgi:hypothetical protein
MSPQLANRILIALSILYGAGIAILAVLNASSLATIAVIGAIVLGALWAIRGALLRRDRST